MRGKARTREEWSKLIAEWGRSGEGVVDFAARHGVRPKSVWHWRSVLAPALRRRQPALTDIVEVRPVRLSGDDRFEVGLVGGRRVAVPPSFDEVALKRLLRVLEASQ